MRFHRVSRQRAYEDLVQIVYEVLGVSKEAATT
jgi:hypothetical protein